MLGVHLQMNIVQSNYEIDPLIQAQKTKSNTNVWITKLCTSTYVHKN